MTAVEWLVQKYFVDYNILISELEFQQAKEMEKQQIIDAYQIGIIDGLNHQPRDYYNETFNKQQQILFILNLIIITFLNGR